MERHGHKVVLIEFIGDLFLLLFFVVMIVGNILRIIMLIKRLSDKEYSDRIRCLNIFCHRYWADVTQEDVDRLTEMLNERRKELNRGDS